MKIAFQYDVQTIGIYEMIKKIALPIDNTLWVMTLDFAVKLMIVDIEFGKIKKKVKVDVHDSFPSLRATRLKNLQIHTVLCGAVSDPLAMLICHSGIKVFPGLTGNADKLIEAYLHGKLIQFHAPDFHPGFEKLCGFGNRGRFRGGKTQAKTIKTKENTIPARDSRGQLKGAGGPKGGQGTAGPDGKCICLHCGYNEPHQRRKPCNQNVCPECGALMTRQ